MNKRLINKLIATKIMGLTEQVDFGEWDSHKWKTNSDGEVDEWAFDNDRHNGVVCVRCYEPFCVSCHDIDNLDEEDKKCTVSIDDYIGNETYAKKAWKKLNENNNYSYELKYCNKNKSFKFRIFNENSTFEAEGNTETESICLACLSASGIDINNLI